MFESVGSVLCSDDAARLPSRLPDDVACVGSGDPGREGCAFEVRDAESLVEAAFRAIVRELEGSRDVDPTSISAGNVSGADHVGAETAGAARARADVAAVSGAALDGLEDVGPGVALAQILATLEVADLTDDALVEVVAAGERLRSWALAVQVRAARELAERAGGSSVAVEGAVAAVGARLCVTRRAAEGLVGLASGLGELPEVEDALRAGRIDERRAGVLVDGAMDLPREQRRGVVADLVGGVGVEGPAGRLTAPRLRDRLRRAIAAFDPEGGARRRERARADRNVRFEPAGECMAYLTALLPADDAARARAGLDALAVTVSRAPGETRTLDQVRADALVALLSGSRPVIGCGGGPAPIAGSLGAAGVRPDGRLPGGAATGAMASRAVASAAGSVGAVPSPGRAEPAVAWTAPTVRTVVHVTVAASTLLGVDDQPAGLTGFGPIPADLARELATGEDVTWQRIVTDPVTGIVTDVSRRTYRPGRDLVRVRDATCTFPGCAVPAWRCDLDHVARFDFGTAERTG